MHAFVWMYVPITHAPANLSSPENGYVYVNYTTLYGTRHPLCRQENVPQLPGGPGLPDEGLATAADTGVSDGDERGQARMGAGV